MMEYAIVRCHGFSLHLLSKEEIAKLAKAENLDTFVKELSKTPYGQKLPEKINLDRLRGIFLEVFLERLHRTAKILPTDLSPVVLDYFRKIEINWILSILIQKISGKKISIEFLPEKCITVNLRKLAKIETFEDAILFLAKHKPYNRIKQRILEEILKTQSILLLRRTLWHVYFENIYDLINKVPEDSRKFIFDIVGTELDITNCMLALSTYLYNLPTDISRELIIPRYYRISQSVLERIITEKSPETIINLLRPYSKIIKVLLEKGETLAYSYTQKFLRRYIEKGKPSIFMQFAYVFYYLKMAEFEYRDLTTCSFGVYHHIPFERLKDYLILID